MSAPQDPVAVEQQIRDLVTRIAKGISVVAKRYEAFLEADRENDREYARAYLAAEGSIEDKKQTARLGTMPAREERDVAEAAFKHADRLARALELELRALQSIGASLRAMYTVAGRGEQ